MGQNLWFRKTPLTNECGQDRRDQGKRQETPIRRPLEKGMEGRGREDLSWDSEENDQRGLAIQLELEAKEACISPPPPPAPCGPGGPPNPPADTVTGTCRRPHTRTHVTDTDLWSQTWTDGDTEQEPTATRTRSHRWALLQEGESSGTDPEGSREGT